MSDAKGYWEIGQEIFENLTIDETIHYTPSADEVLHSCQLRNVTRSKILEQLDKEKCLEHISVSKFIYSILVCYRFIFKYSMRNFEPMLVSSDTSGPFTVKSIGLNTEKLNKVNVFIPLVNTKNSLPEREMEVSTMASRGFNPATGKTKNNFFGIRYHTTTTKHLKPPYTTMCVDYSRTDCITDCINDNVVKIFNRSSSMSNHVSGNRKLVTGSFLNENSANTETYLNIVDNCRMNCPWNECETKVTITCLGESSHWNYIMIYLMLPNTASIVVENHPKMVTIDYITFLLSCLGTWLGFSFLGSNPFKWKRDRSFKRVGAIDYQTIVRDLNRNVSVTRNTLMSMLDNRRGWERKIDREMRVLKMLIIQGSRNNVI